MALLLMNASFLQQYLYSWVYSVPQKTTDPIKVGILSSANINAAAIIHPVESHPEAILYAIASRDAQVARSQARKYKFQKSYGSYEELLSDPAVDLVYISTPNGEHFEWALKAIEAGKHVLLEKPFTSNATEAEKLLNRAREKERICMEAMHWQFHPAAHRFRQILDEHVTNSGRGGDTRFCTGSDGRFGNITRTDAWMTCTPAMPKKDIRWKFELAGGSLMDMGYVLSFTRWALRASTPEVIMRAEARPAPHDARVDAAMNASMRFIRPEDVDAPGGTGAMTEVSSTIYTDMARAWLGGIIPRLWELPSIFVETDRAEVYFFNAQMPHLYHYIAVKDKETGKTTYEHKYAGGPLWGEDRGKPHWSTYRYQLEAVIDRLRGRVPVHWITEDESMAQMESIDSVYKQARLPLRPTSELAL
ncbi:hypothetical protein AMATHDRAFT_60184 [Amanita thiersii Skay4041]|uniref:D-xylose 1-dehydrogenase (NADP(+), D-xylono-1,5-lactone-forming) n=1 Tax=Amanita thiersii Skay4041 TaxID=703135 RepID=A0A2A9NNS6_9AGAR|nr:hypothetical protein AMATHDRAFT_60184 [Amanita thiersii Skay4041]